MIAQVGKSVSLKRWHMRYCRLTTKHLFYWKSNDMNGRCQMINLENVQLVKLGQFESLKPTDLTFEVKTQDRTYTFQAATSEELHQWSQNLQKAISNL